MPAFSQAPHSIKVTDCYALTHPSTLLEYDRTNSHLKQQYKKKIAWIYAFNDPSFVLDNGTSEFKPLHTRNN